MSIADNLGNMYMKIDFLEYDAKSILNKIYNIYKFNLSDLLFANINTINS